MNAPAVPRKQIYLSFGWWRTAPILYHPADMLLSFLGKYREGAMLFMRAGLGIFFILHGLPLIAHVSKWHELGKAMAVIGMTAYPTFWGFMAAASEAIGGILIVIGLFFRPAALLIAFTMTIATLKHYKDHDDFTLRLSHSAELAIVFYSLAVIGPGKYSVDKG